MTGSLFHGNLQPLYEFFVPFIQRSYPRSTGHSFRPHFSPPGASEEPTSHHGRKMAPRKRPLPKSPKSPTKERKLLRLWNDMTIWNIYEIYNMKWYFDWPLYKYIDYLKISKGEIATAFNSSPSWNEAGTPDDCWSNRRVETRNCRKEKTTMRLHKVFFDCLATTVLIPFHVLPAHKGPP